MKKVLVTGATGSIGEAIVRYFAKEGYFVYIHYKRQKDKALALLEEIQQGEMIQCDLTQKEEVKKAFESLHVNVLVNNAGITKDKLFFFMEEEEWSDVMDANLNSLFYVTKQILPNMIKEKAGSIVNVSSISGLVGNGGQVNYSTTKGGIIAFTKALCVEVARYNIRVNAVAPGVIESEMIHNVDKNITNMIPCKRLGRPEEVAEVVFFLGDKATYVNGEVINISGGMVR
ncbi:3-oxoacyl-ACP reductase FabG [Sulfurospirillum multivorans]|uniref:3-oxoacyl-[acyl-carrier-protein] reductase FabG n=2 Tax=Sulfurospirillum multivorans TaxID=66821 RepID=A0AA86ANM2_SULMK|nr:3-oxoacyl-ACP reductase FabG [Sulfurospirillum multivorans]AHJ14165.1 3-oxoacyl-[acyl-carrier-protein] reductase FabG [Sulfurospirillum multivorans DSM 12446]QEH07650.1 3-oxoacyl-[acyl-carrier-protein] reductase FabG [Sulfurospirillum multivorans]